MSPRCYQHREVSTVKTAPNQSRAWLCPHCLFIIRHFSFFFKKVFSVFPKKQFAIPRNQSAPCILYARRFYFLIKPDGGSLWFTILCFKEGAAKALVVWGSLALPQFFYTKKNRREISAFQKITYTTAQERQAENKLAAVTFFNIPHCTASTCSNVY